MTIVIQSANAEGDSYGLCTDRVPPGGEERRYSGILRTHVIFWFRQVRDNSSNLKLTLFSIFYFLAFHR